MGLFDTVRCEYPLPDPAHQDLEFQTKDLDPGMLSYRITLDGRLLREAAGLFAELAREPVELPHHGDVQFYTSVGERREWVEYLARFTHGRVEWIRRIETPPGAALTIEPETEPPPAIVPAVAASREGEPAPATLPSVGANREAELRLLAALAERGEELQKLLASSSDHWGYEDPIYRFYHQSHKVYWLQEKTNAIVAALESLVPDRPLHPWFREIVAVGTGKAFSLRHNREWTTRTRPIVEAFFHARYFLEMAVRYAGLKEPPDHLPSGYAALLALYRLR